MRWPSIPTIKLLSKTLLAVAILTQETVSDIWCLACPKDKYMDSYE
jgi:hypothetical protein